MSRLAAASTTPVTNANMQENSRNSLRILVAMVMIRSPVQRPTTSSRLGGLSPTRRHATAPQHLGQKVTTD
jgi:hypothetical protein